MSKQGPISDFKSRFDETQAEFDFEELSATQAKVKPEGDFIPQIIWLDLNPEKSRLTIEAPLGPLASIDQDLEEVLTISTKIEGYLALGRSDTDLLLVHRLSLTTDQDLAVKPALFHQTFSRFLSSFYRVDEGFFQEKEDQPPQPADDFDEKRDPSDQSEPIGFHA